MISASLMERRGNKDEERIQTYGRTHGKYSIDNMIISGTFVTTFCSLFEQVFNEVLLAIRTPARRYGPRGCHANSWPASHQTAVTWPASLQSIIVTIFPSADVAPVPPARPWLSGTTPTHVPEPADICLCS